MNWENGYFNYQSIRYLEFFQILYMLFNMLELLKLYITHNGVRKIPPGRFIWWIISQKNSIGEFPLEKSPVRVRVRVRFEFRNRVRRRVRIRVNSNTETSVGRNSQGGIYRGNSPGLLDLREFNERNCPGRNSPRTTHNFDRCLSAFCYF